MRGAAGPCMPVPRPSLRPAFLRSYRGFPAPRAWQAAPSGTSSSAYSLPGAAPQSVRDVGQRSRVGAWAQPLTLWGRWVSLRPQPGGGAAVSCPQGGGSAIAGPGGLVSTVVGCSVLGVPGGVLTRPRFMVCFAAASEAGERECVPGGSPALEAPGAGLLAVDGVTGSPPCPGLDHGSPGVGASS